MKTIFRITFLVLFGVVLFNSCTKISEPYYTVKSSIYVDTTKRSVLLEDYTGHLCVNCAPAAKIAGTIPRQRVLTDQVHPLLRGAGQL